jgi:predicted dehydrogenase
MKRVLRPETSTTARRDFLKTSLAAGGAFLILPSGTFAGANSPNNKLNIALIGSYGRGKAHWDAISSENIVALCDINEDHIALAAEKFPKAKHHVDWRKCLEQKDIDSVVCCTTDHTHAFVATWAMNRGFHIYCEKPLANTVVDARIVRDTYLKNKDKIATQVGTQRHAYENFNRVRELIRDGAVGQLQEVHAWGNRQLRRPGYLPASGEPPKNLHYDLWLGPSPLHPYNPDYFSGGPGANCLQWNMYWDFGTGQVGDMGSHTMDIAWNAIDAVWPTSAEGVGEEYNPEVTPVELHTTFEFPANDWRGPIKVHWWQGGPMPENPIPYVDLNEVGHGAMFVGDKGVLVSHFESRVLIPTGDGADLTYYKPRPKEEILPPLGEFQKEWIDACKSDLRTSCNFDYAGTLNEMMVLGLAAYRAGKKLDYDGEKGAVTNSAEANDLLRREYREGWVVNG